MITSCRAETVTALSGQRILIVEDETLLALDLEEILKGWGAEVLGPVPSVEKALQVLSDERPDAATLDMNLRGDSSHPVAAALVSRDIPFVFVSGYSEADSRVHAIREARVVKKPYREADLFEALVAVLRD